MAETHNIPYEHLLAFADSIKAAANPQPIRTKKSRDPDKPKRKHTWTDKNRVAFYEKCVPARLKSLEAKKALKKEQQGQKEEAEAEATIGLEGTTSS